MLLIIFAGAGDGRPDVAAGGRDLSAVLHGASGLVVHCWEVGDTNIATVGAWHGTLCCGSEDWKLNMDFLVMSISFCLGVGWGRCVWGCGLF